MISRWRTLSLAWLIAGASVVGRAAEPVCAVAGRIPTSLRVTSAEVESISPTLTMLSWSGGHKLEIQDVRRVTGSCRNSVVGFSGSEILLKPGLTVRWSETGELSAAVGAKPLQDVPRIPDMSHDDHSHGAVDLGEFIMGARIAGSASPRSANEYFVGVWRPAKHLDGTDKESTSASTIAIYAKTPDGVFSAPAPLLRSTLPVRAVSYAPGFDPKAGVLGLVQEAAGELRLIRVQWTHSDYTGG